MVLGEQRQRVETQLVADFWAKLNELTELYAHYGYFLSLHAGRQATADEDKPSYPLEDQDGAQLKAIVQRLHLTIRMTFIAYRTIEAATRKQHAFSKEELAGFNTITELKDSFTKHFMIDGKGLDAYVLALNKYVATEIATDTLKTATQKVTETYNKALGTQKNGNTTTKH